jgi:hypothetical protein
MKVIDILNKAVQENIIKNKPRATKMFQEVKTNVEIISVKTRGAKQLLFN